MIGSDDGRAVQGVRPSFKFSSNPTASKLPWRASHADYACSILTRFTTSWPAEMGVRTSHAMTSTFYRSHEHYAADLRRSSGRSPSCDQPRPEGRGRGGALLGAGRDPATGARQPGCIHRPYGPLSIRIHRVPEGGRARAGARTWDPLAFERGCREGICGSCGFLINGSAGEPPSGMIGEQSMKEAHLAAIAASGVRGSLPARAAGIAGNPETCVEDKEAR
jgi:2Fe-2S iron-sulfur cluster binding domain